VGILFIERNGDFSLQLISVKIIGVFCSSFLPYELVENFFSWIGG